MRIWSLSLLLLSALSVSAKPDLSALSEAWIEQEAPTDYVQQAQLRGVIVRKMYADAKRSATLVLQDAAINGQRDQLIKDLQIGYEQGGVEIVLNELRLLNGRELLYQERQVGGFRVVILSDVQDGKIESAVISAPGDYRDMIVDEVSKLFPVRKQQEEAQPENVAHESALKSADPSSIGSFVFYVILVFVIIGVVVMLKPKKKAVPMSAATFDVSQLKQKNPSETDESES